MRSGNTNNPLNPLPIATATRPAPKSTPPARENVRTDKVAAIRARLAAGTYTVDFKQLAANIVDDELARGGK